MSLKSNTLKPPELRAVCAQRLWRVLDSENSESLDQVLLPVLQNPEQQTWMSATLYGALRFYPRYQSQLSSLLSKPIKASEGVIHALMIIGMHQLHAMRVKDHAAINETVNACRVLQKDWAIKLANGVLRNYQRKILSQSSSKYKSEVEEFAHPKWIIKTIKKDWPEQWREILDANNQQAKMVLRVNRNKISREDAIDLLKKDDIVSSIHPMANSAIGLQKPVAVNAIPGFDSGYFSVQDASAQLAAFLLIENDALNSDLRVLDACAAPGGKTGHLLERLSKGSFLTALDVSKPRLELVNQTLIRLGFVKDYNIRLKCADAMDPDSWNMLSAEGNKQQFDRILLDAPCTASGVIRRHPDIKIRRSPQQLADVIQTQANILQSLWSTLKSGGRLLYATCSVFQAENEVQIKQFVTTHTDAKVIPLKLAAAINTQYGSQILPGNHMRDGFFYALLEKH
jgi:16S rRNA (cytosine967-C5)-methyltransferase